MSESPETPDVYAIQSQQTVKTLIITISPYNNGNVNINALEVIACIEKPGKCLQKIINCLNNECFIIDR